MERVGLVTGTIQLSPMPLFHTAGCVMSVLGSIACRGSLVLPPMFEPGLLLELLQSERAQYVLGVPTMLIGVLDHPEFAATDTSSVRWLITGGAVVPPALVQRVEAAFGVPLTVVFAQTEASPVITQTAPGDEPDDRAHTLGRALPQTEVKIVDTTTGPRFRDALRLLPRAARGAQDPAALPDRRRIPAHPSGKVKKYVLREQLLADLGTGAAVSGPDVPAAAPPG